MNLNALVVATEKTLGRLIGEDIILSFKPADNLWTVRMDPSQFDQILMNLIVNSRDAMPDGGYLTIETTNERIDEDYARQVSARTGEYVRLTVSDTGVGMDQETRKHIFEPFYTTKELGKGTGLGLATIFGIVSQNDGFIAVYSEVGHGTTINIFLPRSEEEGTVAEVPVKAAATGKGIILLVEDDQMVLEMTSSMLMTLGYTVISAGSPAEAIQLCKDPEVPIDMIISDVIMPTMSGKVMIEHILKYRPRLRVLFMSGYTSDIIAQKGILEEGICFINKPFDMKTLSEKVNQTLAGE